MRIILLLISFLISLNSFAQDLIITKNRDTICATNISIVKFIDRYQIKYEPCNRFYIENKNINSPVTHIIYSNGSIRWFEKESVLEEYFNKTNRKTRILMEFGAGYYCENLVVDNELSKFAFVGIQIDALVEILIKKKLAFTTGLGYSHCWFSTQYDDYSIIESKNNLQIPLLLHYYFGRKNHTGFFLGVGAKANFFLGGKLSINSGGVVSDEEKIDKSNFNTVGITLNGTIGYQFKTIFRFAAFYDYRVTNMASSKFVKEVEDLGLKWGRYNNTLVGFKLGFAF